MEKAVKLDPMMPRNHNNLCVAYLKTGNIKKVWYHTRKAVLCPIYDQNSFDNYNELYRVLVKDQGLDKEGTSLENITQALGEPDLVLQDDDEVIAIVYGARMMQFKWETIQKLVN